MTDDTYYTIGKHSKGIFKDRGSKFIGLTYSVNSIEEIKGILDDVKNEYRDARHHCYAYSLGKEDENIWRVNDDGEPSGTAGKPILGQIHSAGITNVLIVVIRYFGGTLLGVGGLINAYRNAAREAITNSGTVKKIIKKSYIIHFPYSAMNEVMTLVKEKGLEQAEQVFELECSMKITFRLSEEDIVAGKLRLIKDLTFSEL